MLSARTRQEIDNLIIYDKYQRLLLDDKQYLVYFEDHNDNCNSGK